MFYWSSTHPIGEVGDMLATGSWGMAPGATPCPGKIRSVVLLVTVSEPRRRKRMTMHRTWALLTGEPPRDYGEQAL